jgi:hypothetical protein
MMSRPILEFKLASKRLLGTVTRTVRIDRIVDSRIVALADKERLSTNFVVNKALRRYVEWEADAEHFGFASIPNSLVGKTFEYLSEEQARDFGAWAGKNKIPEIVSFWFKKLDVENILQALDLMGTQYGRAFRFEYAFDGRIYTLILKHDMGPKASAFYSELVKSLFDVQGSMAETMETEDQIVAKVYPPEGHRSNTSSSSLEQYGTLVKAR